jgi:hypothetical protein
MPDLPNLLRGEPAFLFQDQDAYLVQKKEFLLWIGLCITEWSKVDLQMLRTTCDALGTGSKRTAIVYLRSGMISKRIELVSELVESILMLDEDGSTKTDRPLLLQEWDGIEKELREIIPFRNKLAHWTLSAGRRDGQEEFKPCLGAGIPESFREKKYNYVSIFCDDIAAHYARLQAVVDKISSFGPAFAIEVKKLPTPSRKLSWLWKPPTYAGSVQEAEGSAPHSSG